MLRPVNITNHVDDDGDVIGFKTSGFGKTEEYSLPSPCTEPFLVVHVPKGVCWAA